MIRCPCVNCKNVRYQTTKNTSMHLMMNGFKPGYTVWTCHGEVDSDNRFNNFVVGEISKSMENNVEVSTMSDMSHNALGMHSNYEFGEIVEKAPNEEVKIFYEQLHDASRPLFNGSPHYKLSIAIRLLSIKFDWNIAQRAIKSLIHHERIS